MKKQVGIAVCAWLCLLTVTAVAAPLDLAQAVHYTAPTNFFNISPAAARTDPGDSPLSLGGLQFLDYKDKNYRNFSEVIFQVGLAGVYIGPGKILHCSPVTPSLLKNEIESEYHRNFPEASATLNKINGMTSVSLTATRPPGPVRPYFLHFCWIEVETNIIVKVSVYSCDTNSFAVATNSLQSIKIDKEVFLKALDHE